MPSYKTTNFGPIVSLQTSKADPRAPHLYLDSNTTLTAAGPVAISGTFTPSGTVNLAGATLLSDQTSASLTSATLADGQLSVGSVSVTSATIYFRSGVTTYQFVALDSAVL
jgi:hypothetical protein